MKILEIKKLSIPEIKVIKFGRFCDNRGYFCEPFRKSVVSKDADTDFLNNIEFVQVNESFSKKGVLRGLHFQWNPYMGKLVRTIRGSMVDLILDIRKGSPTLGKIIAYDMPDRIDENSSEWIWVPAGFAHGNYFRKETTIEYFCSGEYSPGCEAGISPLAPDLDWSLCEPKLRTEFVEMKSGQLIITDKDKNGLALREWIDDSRSENFIYNKLR